MNRNITATILIILAIGVYFTVTKGVMDEITVVKEVNSKYENAIENAKKLITLRDQVRDDYNNLSAEDRARIEVMLPKRVDNIRLILDLNSVALSHGLSLKGIKASVGDQSSDQMNGPSTAVQEQMGPDGFPVQTASNSAQIPVPTKEQVSVSFGLSASYQQFISFLQSLEASLRILDVTHIGMEATDDGVYNWNVELNTYWLKSE